MLISTLRVGRATLTIAPFITDVVTPKAIATIAQMRRGRGKPPSAVAMFLVVVIGLFERTKIQKISQICLSIPLRPSIIAPEQIDFCLFRNNETKKIITLRKSIGSKM